MGNDKGITQYFGTNLAELLSEKILLVYQEFNKQDYISTISENCNTLGYTKKIELHADQLYKYLPNDFIRASKILISILGEENINETGCSQSFIGSCPSIFCLN